MNRWFLPLAVGALLVVGWQHRGQSLTRACMGIADRAVPGQASAGSMGGAWQEQGARAPGENPLHAFCRSLAQGN